MIRSSGQPRGYNEALVHPYYHFHGFAGNQIAGDGKLFDLAAGNHGLRGANLTDASMFTSAGYVSTTDPTGGTLDTAIHIPSLNYDYIGGEKLIVWWLGAVTPEGAHVPILGDGYGTTAGQRGWRVRAMTDGKFDVNLIGATSGFGGSSASAVFDGTLHSFAFCLDGVTRNYGMWSDEVYQAAFGTVLSPFGASAAFDTLSSTTVNIGTSRPAVAATTEGAATKTRAIVILRLPASYSMPTVAVMTGLFSQLRANPGKLILANAI